jgi:UDP-2-acetamido-3-amino-2,3-dideoxy-glucuronate N-acetyltransferase
VIDSSVRVHAAADVEGDASIGPGSSVDRGARVRTGARIGRDTSVGRDAFIDTGVAIGDRVRILDRALVYRGVTVEDAVYIGPAAILTNDRYPRAVTATGEVAQAGDRTVSPTVLRHGCSIGAGAVVVAGSDVGRFATVGAGAVVTRRVPGHALVVGSPAERIGWVCACGARLYDSNGNPAPAAIERYATDPILACTVCGRGYAYIPDVDSLTERRPAHSAAPVGA